MAQIIFSQEPGREAGSWFYLAVTPFYSSLEEIKSADLHSCWENGISSSHPFNQILLSEDTHNTFTMLWGPSNPNCVEIAHPNDLSRSLWSANEAVGLIPFEMADPSLKVLPIDSEDPFGADFNRDIYPLALRINYELSDPGLFPAVPDFYITNFDSSKLTSIALTGVTAMVRHTAYIMEKEGILYPAIDIQGLLADADITHINNEVPFASDCPYPDANQYSLNFCSDDRYIQLMEAIGTDIVELSGDHFGDWGPEAMLHTIDLYDQEGWLTYGGGENLTAGLSPVYLSHNENHFAFIGCNAKNVERYATASSDNPGAVMCDFEWMIPEIERLASEGYLVIATMQHEEVDDFGSISLQRYDFRRLAEAGAVIVSGSQSHHPQGFEYTGSSFIHYGLGNLFFDQWRLALVDPELHANKDKSFVDLHFFYNGKHIGTRLVPLQFVDNARPRLMTAEEKTPLMNEIYAHSFWNGEWIYLYSSGYISSRTDQ